MERKKTSLLIIGVCALVLSIIGITYAFWQLRLSQTDENNLTSSCFDVSLINEGKAIQLTKAYPMEDKEGEQLEAYTFTIKNNCKANAKYQINLESLIKLNSGEEVTERLDEKYLKVKLNEVEKDGSIQELTESNSVSPTIIEGQTEGKARADKAYKLTTGYLEPEKEKQYELRLWLDGDLTMEDTEAMNKTYASKITVIATYAKEAKKSLVDTILAIKPETEDNGVDGLYEVTHEDASITYTNDPFYQTRLTQTELRYAGKDPNNYVSFGEEVAEDKFELILCMQGMCANIQAAGVPLESVFSTSEACEAGKTQAESYLSSLPVEYSLNCEQTATKGDPLYWRIIGLVNTPEGQRIKLIKNDSIGNFSWDTSTTNVNYGYGVNEWSQSDLMKLLNPGFDTNQDQICAPTEDGRGTTCSENDNLVNNSLYWNGGKGKCYNSASNVATDCDFTNNTIPENLKQMIEEVTWNIGSNGTEYSYDNIKVNEFYNIERSNNTGDICKSGSAGNYCNDDLSRTTSWKGKVGLMYSSDYGYATSGGGTDDRNTCLNTPVTSWYDYYNEEEPVHHPDCYENDWLLPSTIDWTISPIANSDDSYNVFGVYSRGFVGYDSADTAGGVRPSVYLKPDVFVTSGNGSTEAPYILSGN